MLDYEKPIPLHIQLKEIIENNVASGLYKDQIPSERLIMEEFDVSRSTVREAVNLLVREGILEKRHGIGTFISLKPLHAWLGNLTSTSETIRAMGMKPGAELIESFITSPPEHVQRKTNWKETYFIKRIRYADKIPIGIEWHYYPLSIGKQLQQFDLQDVALYDLIENELGVRFAEAKQTIRSGQFLPEDLLYLNVPNESHTLIAERVIRDKNGEIIEFEEAYYRGDMYQIDINLSRKFG